MLFLLIVNATICSEDCFNKTQELFESATFPENVFPQTIYASICSKVFSIFGYFFGYPAHLQLCLAYEVSVVSAISSVI